MILLRLLVLPVLLALARPALAVNDGSLNQESIPPSGFTCMVVLPVNYARGTVEVQNRSTDAIKLVLDDGAGGHATVLSLPAAPGAGQGGGAWNDFYFKGRVQICVPTANAGTDIVAARED